MHLAILAGRIGLVHYLRQEVLDLFGGNEWLLELVDRKYDGIWMWDLENPEHEWMSPGFWYNLGFDPNTKKHSPDEWQNLIHPVDLSLAQKNFEKHCQGMSHPYVQTVRYSTSSGKTKKLICHGFALNRPNPTRMIGFHTNI